jgi:hypothetical protein
MLGKAAAKQEPLLWWKVKAVRQHGGLIHGYRRVVGECFQAPERAMTFDVLEGLVEETDPPADVPATQE